MAIHSKAEEMLKASLEEMYIASCQCISFRKEDGGCLGYPAAILLLSIVDVLGSYYKGYKNFTVQVDGKFKSIDGDAFKHFYILNSEYYNLQLSEKTLKKIYDNYRSLLIHNGIIPNNHLLNIDDPLQRPFTEDAWSNSINGETYPSLNLVPLCRANRFAINKFFKEIDNVVPNSKQLEIITKKKFFS